MLAVMQKFDAPDGAVENRWTEIVSGVGNVANFLQETNKQFEEVFDEIDHVFAIEADGWTLGQIAEQLPGVKVIPQANVVRFVGDEARYIVANLVL